MKSHLIKCNFERKKWYRPKEILNNNRKRDCRRL